MASTITFTPINDGSFYTIDELNDLFKAAAAVINSKLDVAIGQERQGVLVGTQRVVRTADPVILTDAQSSQLVGDLLINLKRLRNLRQGAVATDAITVAQARTILAG